MYLEICKLQKICARKSGKDSFLPFTTQRSVNYRKNCDSAQDSLGRKTRLLSNRLLSTRLLASSKSSKCFQYYPWFLKPRMQSSYWAVSRSIRCYLLFIDIPTYLYRNSRLFVGGVGLFNFHSDPFIMGYSQPPFLYFRLMNSKQQISSFYNVADYRIRTADICYWKQPLCQLSQNIQPVSLYFILATFIFPQFLSLYNLGIFCLLKCLTTFLFKPPPPLCLFIIFFYVFICFNVNSLSLLCICTLTTFSVQMLICATIILSISVLQCFSLFSPAMFIFSLLCVTFIICISGLQMGYVCFFLVPLCESISVCVQCDQSWRFFALWATF